MILLGVDIGIPKKTGWSEYSTVNKSILSIHKGTPLDFIDWIRSDAAKDLSGIIVEDNTIDDNKNWHGASARKNIGKNLGACIIVKDCLDRLDIPVLYIAPSTRTRYKAMIHSKCSIIVRATKVPHDKFCEWTGWDKKIKTSEDERDAAMLSFFAQERWFLSQLKIQAARQQQIEKQKQLSKNGKKRQSRSRADQAAAIRKKIRNL